MQLQKTVTLKTSGYKEKTSQSVCSAAAKGNGTKLKPMVPVVFKVAKQEVAVLNKEFQQKAVIATSPNAWMYSVHCINT